MRVIIRMSRGRICSGSVAASAVLACALSLCSPGARVDALAAGEPLFAALARSGDIAGAPVAAPAASSFYQVPQRVPGDEGAAADGDGYVVGTATTSPSASGQAGAPEGDAQKEQPEQTGTATTREGDTEFGGSVKPAGPDLTTEEERVLIENGWK